MWALSREESTGCDERDAQVVTSLFEGNAETIYDELVGVVQKGKIEAFIYTT